MTALNRVFPLSALCVCVLLSGCAMGDLGSSSGPSTVTAIAGIVHGGQSPVSGALVQLYAASTTATAGASKALLASAVPSGSDGSFTLTSYTCPSNEALLYLVATGGNPGLSGSVNNTALSLMAVVGTCSELSADSYLIVNELSTVASVQALSAFMTDYAHIGANTSGPNGLAGAFDNASAYVDITQGNYGFASNYAAFPYLLSSTLADVIGACVNTNGTDGTCSNLFGYAGSSSDTVSAALKMVQNPANNTAKLYGLIPSNPPFQPYLTSVPTDFTSTAGYTVSNYSTIQTGVLDSNGHIWLYTADYTYDPATDTSTNNPGIVTVYDNNFNQMFTVSPGSGGLYYPSAMAADTSGNVYMVNSNNTISKSGSNGSPLTPSTGWNTGIAPSFSISGSGNYFQTNDNQVSAIKVDALGNIFGITPYGSTNCYLEMNSSGQVTTPSGNFCTTAGDSSYIESGAPDGSGNAWALGPTTVSLANSSGNFVVSTPKSTGCFDPGGGTSVATLDIVYDRTHNQLWGYSETGIGTVSDSGTSVFCETGSTTLPLISKYASTSHTAGSPYSGGALYLASGVLDGAGNFWYVSSGYTASGVVGTTVGTFTGTTTFSNYLNGISSTGALLTTYNASTQTYGLQPSGFGSNATASVTNGYPEVNDTVGLLGVDPYGNIWALDIETSKLLKIMGLASANTINY